MAHFAELDSDNIVLRVVVIDNNDVIANGGDQSEQTAEYVKKIVKLSPRGVKWIQTSYNNNFRGVFAGVNYKYIPEKDTFISSICNFPSWTLNDQYEWVPPVIRPTDGTNGTIDQRYRDISITSAQGTDSEGNIININLPNGKTCPMSWSEYDLNWVCYDSLNIKRKWNPNNQNWEIV